MWLVEGIADYIRFFRWKPGTLGRINPNRAHYNGSYCVTASFLKYLVDRYDRDAVRKLNRAAREGMYRESLFEEITGKGARVLSEEWRSELPRIPADFDPGAAVDLDEPDEIPLWRLAAAAAIGGAAGWLIGYRRRRQYGRRPT